MWPVLIPDLIRNIALIFRVPWRTATSTKKEKTRGFCIETLNSHWTFRHCMNGSLYLTQCPTWIELLKWASAVQGRPGGNDLCITMIVLFVDPHAVCSPYMNTLFGGGGSKRRYCARGDNQHGITVSEGRRRAIWPIYTLLFGTARLSKAFKSYEEEL